jgi:hypothetical protein
MTVANGLVNSSNSTENSTDELEYGRWISLQDVQTIPFDVDYFWSAFDDYLSLLKSFSGRQDVKSETGFGIPLDGPGAIVRFDFKGSVVRDRLLINDRVNHVWKMDIPEATPLFTLYHVTFSAREVTGGTEVKINVDFVLQSEKRQERADALKTLKEFLPKRISEIIKFLKEKNTPKDSFAPVTESEIRHLVAEFYSKLDAHAPVDEYAQFFAFDEEDFLMQFPSETLHSWEDFKQWYDSSINLYFDEIHQLKEINATPNGNHTDVKAIVHWEGSLWKAPTSHSKRIIADAHHTWVVKRCSQTLKPLFKSYVVHKLDLGSGSPQVEAPVKVSTAI